MSLVLFWLHLGMMVVCDYGKVKLKTRKRRHRVLLSEYNMFYSQYNNKNKIKYFLKRKKQRLARY